MALACAEPFGDECGVAVAEHLDQAGAELVEPAGGGVVVPPVHESSVLFPLSGKPVTITKGLSGTAVSLPQPARAMHERVAAAGTVGQQHLYTGKGRRVAAILTVQGA